MNGGITSPSLVTTVNPMMWTGGLVFINIGISCGNRVSQRLFLEFTNWSWQKFSYQRKPTVCSDREDGWVCWKGLQRDISSCPLWLVIKITRNDGFNLSCTRSTECLHALRTYLETHVSCYGPGWLTENIVNHGLDLNKFGSSFLIRTIGMRLPSCYRFIITMGLTQPFLNLLHCPQINTQAHWNLRIELLAWVSNCTVCRFRNSGRLNCVVVLLFLQTVPNWLFCSTVNKTWNKRKHMREINTLKWWLFTLRTPFIRELILEWIQSKTNKYDVDILNNCAKNILETFLRIDIIDLNYSH